MTRESRDERARQARIRPASYSTCYRNIQDMHSQRWRRMQLGSTLSDGVVIRAVSACC